VDLTVAEITYALERLGGIDIKSITLPQRLDTINEVVVVSGTSLRHLKKMADAIVSAVSPS
jgi:ribosomal silencing factor RsfS